MPVIPVLGRLKQEDFKLGASLGYTVRPCLRKILKIEKRKKEWKKGRKKEEGRGPTERQNERERERERERRPLHFWAKGKLLYIIT
jgi:hypothetical protein